MKTRLKRISLLLGAALLSGCMASEADLGPRASFDLNCPQSDLQIVALTDTTRGVRGCGHQATYVSHCNGQPGALGTTCDWVMDNHQ